MQIKSFSKILPKGFESINTITDANTKTLWIGTDNGLLIFNKVNEIFSVLKLDSIPLKIQVLYLLPDSNLLIGTNKGLYSYSISSKKVLFIHSGKSAVSSRSSVTGILGFGGCLIFFLDSLFFSGIL